MSLDIYERENLRKSVEEILEKSPEDQRVPISKNLLEQLLFEEVILNEEENIVIKLPVWSGEFLQKIDLSQVDFSNVSWSALYYLAKYKNFFDHMNPITDYICQFNKNNKFDNREVILNRLMKIENLERLFEGRVNYSGTNANIDLSKSFEALHCDMINVSGCEFKGCKVVFSKKLNNFNLNDCDFTNSTIKLPKVVKDTSVKECVFENCDLSESFFDITTMLSEGKNLNNLKNTKVKLFFRDSKIDYFTIFKQKLLAGCYLDDELIDDEIDQIPPKEPGL